MKKGSSIFDTNIVAKIAAKLFFVCLISLFFVFTVAAQPEPNDEMPDGVAPPPLKRLTQEEKKQLEGETNPKKRNQVSMDLMDARIKAAENFHKEDDFMSALNQLGSFQLLMNGNLDFLIKKDDGGGKADKNFKNFEIFLRSLLPRLETLRREMPFKYAWHVERLLKSVRSTREKALDPLFSDTVVPEKPEKKP